MSATLRDRQKDIVADAESFVRLIERRTAEICPFCGAEPGDSHFECPVAHLTGAVRFFLASEELRSHMLGI